MNSFKALRLWLHYSQEQLAGRLGVSAATISGWETGLRTPSLKHIVALAELSCLRVDDVLSFRLVPGKDFQLTPKEVAEENVLLRSTDSDRCK